MSRLYLSGGSEVVLRSPFDLSPCISIDMIRGREILVGWGPHAEPRDDATWRRLTEDQMRALCEYDHVLDAVIWRLGWRDAALIAWDDGLMVLGVRPVQIAEWRDIAVAEWRKDRQ